MTSQMPWSQCREHHWLLESTSMLVSYIGLGLVHTLMGVSHFKSWKSRLYWL